MPSFALNFVYILLTAVLACATITPILVRVLIYRCLPKQMV